MSVIPARPFSVITTCDISVSDYSYSSQSHLTLDNKSTTMDWSADGSRLYIGLKTDRYVRGWVAATPWSVTGLTLPTNYGYGFVPEINSGGSVWSTLVNTAPDGTAGGQMLLNLAFGLSICKIAQYTLPFPYDLRQGNPPGTGSPLYPTYTPVFIGSYDTTADTAADAINDMRMSPDGTRLIAVGSTQASAATLFQWNLTTPYDVLGGMTFQTPVVLSGYDFRSLYVPPSGACLYLGSTGTINQFTMSAWEISTLNTTPVDTLDVSSELPGVISSIYVTENDLYALGTDNGDVYQYSR